MSFASRQERSSSAKKLVRLEYDAALFAHWVDPDFDPTERAFYYVRVIEIPTPRWTAYDAKRFGITLPKNVPMTTQERAYTSPIWYTP